MTSLQNGYVNGHVSGLTLEPTSTSKRFSDIPPAVDIVIEGQETVELDLEGLPEDPTELCTLLENESAPPKTWLTTALAYAKHSKVDEAIDVLNRGLSAHNQPTYNEQSLLSCICWLELRRSRGAPRMVPGTL